jgi:hypothetical protein
MEISDDDADISRDLKTVIENINILAKEIVGQIEEA